MVAAPTVYIVDDDCDMRDSLALLVETLGFNVRAFDCARSFGESYHASYPGCLILDVRMPGENGLDMYERMLREGQRLPVIFITAHADVSTAVAAMKTGAIEFLEKPFDQRSLLELIEKALQLDSSWRNRDREFRLLDEKVGRLTRSDRETLELLLRGQSNKIMAARLNITERAVELRRARLMKRLGVRSLAELLELAITHRLLDEIRHVSEQNLRGIK